MKKKSFSQSETNKKNDKILPVSGVVYENIFKNSIFVEK